MMSDEDFKIALDRSGATVLMAEARAAVGRGQHRLAVILAFKAWDWAQRSYRLQEAINALPK
jgi:hypothetical protein